MVLSNETSSRYPTTSRGTHDVGLKAYITTKEILQDPKETTIHEEFKQEFLSSEIRQFHVNSLGPIGQNLISIGAAINKQSNCLPKVTDSKLSNKLNCLPEVADSDLNLTQDYASKSIISNGHYWRELEYSSNQVNNEALGRLDHIITLDQNLNHQSIVTTEDVLRNSMKENGNIRCSQVVNCSSSEISSDRCKVHKLMITESEAAADDDECDSELTDIFDSVFRSKMFDGDESSDILECDENNTFFQCDEINVIETIHKKRINAVSKELIIKVTIRINGKTLSFDGVIDTGAGYSYFMACQQYEHLQFAVPFVGGVKLADGTISKIRSAFATCVQV